MRNSSTKEFAITHVAGAKGKMLFILPLKVRLLRYISIKCTTTLNNDPLKRLYQWIP